MTMPALIAGPFADFIGQVEELVSGDRVKLLFNFMEQYKSVELSSVALGAFILEIEIQLYNMHAKLN